jgi:alginate O-acetyltransferase complex protein AlgI
VLFNSGEFCFIFLPVTLAFFYAASHWHLTRLAIWILGLASAIFYLYGTPVVPGPWGIPVPPYLLLLLASIVGNYFIGAALRHRRSAWTLGLGVAVNLSVLGYFKYANFFIHNFNHLSGDHILWPHIFLPLGISFYTFQSIAYLADCQQGKVGRHSMLDFAVFLHFFPQLIAGPIVHHREMLPQFRSLRTFVVNHRNIATGFALFTLGLAKKVMIADHFSDWVGEPFLHVAALSLSGAWAAVLSFGFQLYFDFSGYSDMAIGLGLLFNVRYPQNFNSPYKADSLIDFWRRWHMTLSRFLRDYVYSARRQPAWQRAPLCESADHDAARRILARRGMDLCHLGRVARLLFGGESRVGRTRLEAAPGDRPGLDAARRLSGLGFFPQS